MNRVVPPSDAALTRRLCAWTTDCTMARPRPVPLPCSTWSRRAGSTRSKRSKRRGRPGADLVRSAHHRRAAGRCRGWRRRFDCQRGLQRRRRQPAHCTVRWMLQTLRKRSMETRVARLQVPDLSEQHRIAGNYQAMCVGCHLAPGMEATGLSRGLYPSPPNLSREEVEPRPAFWAVKHGINASAMPACGKSMNDEAAWNMTAFLVRLPQMDAAQCEQLVASRGGHSHGGAEGGAAHHHEHGEGSHQDHAACMPRPAAHQRLRIELKPGRCRMDWAASPWRPICRPTSLRSSPLSMPTDTAMSTRATPSDERLPIGLGRSSPAKGTHHEATASGRWRAESGRDRSTPPAAVAGRRGNGSRGARSMPIEHEDSRLTRNVLVEA